MLRMIVTIFFMSIRISSNSAYGLCTCNHAKNSGNHTVMDVSSATVRTFFYQECRSTACQDITSGRNQCKSSCSPPHNESKQYANDNSKPYQRFRAIKIAFFIGVYHFCQLIYPVNNVLFGGLQSNGLINIHRRGLYLLHFFRFSQFFPIFCLPINTP